VAQFAVKDIKPNPFRHMDRYPIRREKVEVLRESLRATGFWGNVVARLDNGKPEIAYGHHRLVALREEYGPSHKVDLVIRDLHDDTMLQIMARENMEEWGTSAPVEHETVRAVVEAYAEDQIELPAPETTNRQHIRYAPSFTPGLHLPARGGGLETRPYTGQTLAEFLGWLKPSGEAQAKVHDALTALQFIDEGVLRESDFEGLSTKEAQAVIEQARRAKADREAAARLHRQQAEQAAREAEAAERRRAEAERVQREREAAAARARDEAEQRRAQEEARRAVEARREAEEAKQRAEERRKTAERQQREEQKRGRQQASTVGRAVSRELREGRISYRQAPTAAAKVAEKKEGPPPHIDDFARRLASDLSKILDEDRDPRVRRLTELVKFREHIEDFTRSDLAHTLAVVAERASGYAEQLSDGWPETRPAQGRRELPATTGG
jgi:hypothetical protein